VNLLLGSLTVGLMLALLSLGVLFSFRVLRHLDLTTDGAFTTGGAVTGALLVAGVHPLAATFAGGVAGTLAGTVTGLIHTRWRVDVILAGILVTTALYSIDFWIMGGGNLSLANYPTVFDLTAALLPARDNMEGVTLSRDLVALVALVVIVGAHALLLALFVGTDIGLALRATGSSPRMAKASAIDTGLATTFGLAIANGCSGFSGALFVQYQGFANIQMGVGMIVTGLASVILGEALFSQRTIRRRITAAILGAMVFRLMVAAALWAGLDPNALKLVTAAFVLAALTVPRLVRQLRTARASRG
jgi:putative tryptophan/tyrosine transport system permease protein